MSITLNEKRKQFTQFLLKELGKADKVKEFSQLLRELHICDLRDDEDFDHITKDGAPYLLTLLTHYNFGLLGKLVEIKRKIKGE